jgi:hypothetical protein
MRKVVRHEAGAHLELTELLALIFLMPAAKAMRAAMVRCRNPIAFRNAKARVSKIQSMLSDRPHQGL